MIGTPGHALSLSPDMRTWRRARALDGALDLMALPWVRGARRDCAGKPDRALNVLVLAVVRDGYESIWRLADAELRSSRHRVSIRTSGIEHGGKFTNLNLLLEDSCSVERDWLLLADDDVVLPRGFLDVFLLAAERSGLRIAQPAHRLVSHASWPVTRRRALSIARLTNFVEIGPVTALHRSVVPALTPFPSQGMGWGVDYEWAREAKRRSWPIGVVDLTPIVHLAPAGSAYSAEEAAVTVRRELYEPPTTIETFRRWSRMDRAVAAPRAED
jgi:hypothetical protein